MSQEERSAVVSIFVNIAVDLWVILRLWDLWQTGALGGPDGLQIWARTVLWAIPMAIVGTIVLTILAAILHGAITRQPDIGKDERDTAYQLRGMATTMIVASFGVVAAIVVLCFGGGVAGWSKEIKRVRYTESVRAILNFCFINLITILHCSTMSPIIPFC